MATDPKKKKSTKPKPFDVKAFKKGIYAVETNSGQSEWNTTSSATGKYQFLYNDIKDIPEMKGVTREQFAKNYDLQEKIMDMAVNGKIRNRPGYYKNASDLTKDYKTMFGDKWNYREDEVAVLSHFLGRQGARDYLNAEATGGNYTVPGKNLEVEDYLQRYNKGAGYTRGLGKTQNLNASAPTPKQGKFMVPNEREQGLMTQDNLDPANFKPQTILTPGQGSPKSQPTKQQVKPKQQTTSTDFLIGYLNNNEFAKGGDVKKGPGDPPAKQEKELGMFGKIKSFLNPMNLGVDNYDDSGSFKQAFDDAKSVGEPEFLYKGRRYNTKVDGMTKAEEFRKYGINSDQATHNNSLRDLITKKIEPDESRYGYGNVTDGSGDYMGNSGGKFGMMKALGKDLMDPSYDVSETNKGDLEQDIFNLYMGKPVNDPQTSKVGISQYSNDDQTQYTLKNAWSEINRHGVYDAKKEEKDYNYLNDFVNSDEESRASTHFNLGNFQMGKGTDEKGSYIDYTDKWDLHPMGKDKNSVFNKAEQLGLSEDQSQGLGKPLNFYDRRYYTKGDKGEVLWNDEDKYKTKITKNQLKMGGKMADAGKIPKCGGPGQPPCSEKKKDNISNVRQRRYDAGPMLDILKPETPMFSQDNRTSHERVKDNARTREINEAGLSALTAPLVYLDDPLKLPGDIVEKFVNQSNTLTKNPFPTSKKDAIRVAKNKTKSQSKGEQLKNHTKIGLGYVPKAALNVGLGAALSPKPNVSSILNETVNPLASGVKKVSKSFKSEINWKNWNKEISNNKPLLKEYNAIEQQAKENGSWMKNPDGSKFKGNPEQFIQQQSENFKKSFGDSKLLNPDGSPVIGYHGGPSNIKEFNAPSSSLYNKNKDLRGTGKHGIYFTGAKNKAKKYSKSYNKNEREVYDSYLKMDKPYLSKNHILSNPIDKTKFRHHAITDKNIHHIGTSDGVKVGKNNSELIVFEPNQIKSATGNNGMFDMTNPNIYKSVAGAGGIGALMNSEKSSANNSNELEMGGKIADGGKIPKCGDPGQPPCEPLDSSKTANTLGNLAGNLGQYFFDIKDDDLKESNYRPTIKSHKNPSDKQEKYYSRPGMRSDVYNDLISDRVKKDYNHDGSFNDIYKGLKSNGKDRKHNADNAFPNNKAGYKGQYNKGHGTLNKGEFNLGRYRTDAGEDDKGKYISFVDKYDWNGMRIGNTINFYDRIYEDDWKQFENSTQSKENEAGKKLEKLRGMPTGNKFKMGGKMNKYQGGQSQGGMTHIPKSAGTHAQNPNGGVQVGMGENGKANTVEGGETMKNDYVYSDTLKLDDAIIKKVGLPKNFKGKTMAEASKMIQGPVDEQVNNKIVKDTADENLAKLKSANEIVRMAQEVLNPKQGNTHTMPDGSEMPGSHHNQNQATEGYDFGAPPDGDTNPFGNVFSRMLNQPMNTSLDTGTRTQGLKSYDSNNITPSVGGLGTGSLSTMKRDLSSGKSIAGMGDDYGLTQAPTGNIPEFGSSTSGAGSPGAGAYVGAAQAAVDMGTDIANAGEWDKSGLNDSEKYDQVGGALSGTMKGAQAGSAFGPIGAAAGAVGGLQLSLISGQKKQKAAENQRAAYDQRKMNSNSFFLGGNLGMDKDVVAGQNPATTSYFKQGGYLNQFKTGGDTNPFGNIFSRMLNQPMDTSPIELREREGLQFVDENKHNIMGRDDSGSLGAMQRNLDSGKSAFGLGDDFGLTKAPTGNISFESGSWWDRNKSKVGDTAAQAARYAPAAMNALQLGNLGGPEEERLDRLDNRYKPNYMDERTMQNQAESSYNNAARALTGASGGSQGALRANLLAAHLNKQKGVSQAYQQAAGVNRAEDARAQDFNLNVDSKNMAQSLQEKDWDARNRGAYDSNKSKLLSQIGTDVGNIGLEETRKKYPDKLGLLYDYLGKFQE